jgi:pimeloyl-ACP methyl ester carboxylesterase
MSEEVKSRIHGSKELPTLIYLPGLHGNWKLLGGFRRSLKGRVCLVEISYPSTLTWSLAEHGAAVERALIEQGIGGGWLLGESFSSQVVWAMLEGNALDVKGVILAGGFVKHPYRWATRMGQRFCDEVSFGLLRRILFGYARVCRFRFRRSPETYTEIREFVTSMTPLELQAAKHRLHLLAQSDYCAIARQMKVPLYALSGLFDPVVPWLPVRRWLNKNCPVLREYKVIWRADHNVLGTAPDLASDQIVRWMTGR